MPRRRKLQTELPVIGDPLVVIPRVAKGVVVREASNGEYHLRKTYPPQGRVRKFLHRRLGWKRETYHNLDQRGTYFWKQIDGKRSVSDIMERLMKEWSITREEAMEASVVYIQHLMVRNLVVLEIPGREVEE